jgi:hypothetical protein
MPEKTGPGRQVPAARGFNDPSIRSCRSCGATRRTTRRKTTNRGPIRGCCCSIPRRDCRRSHGCAMRRCATCPTAIATCSTGWPWISPLVDCGCRPRPAGSSVQSMCHVAMGSKELPRRFREISRVPSFPPEKGIHIATSKRKGGPWLRENLDDDDMEMVDEAQVEHQTAKDLIAQIEAPARSFPRFRARRRPSMSSDRDGAQARADGRARPGTG